MNGDPTKLLIGAGLLTWALTSLPTVLAGRVTVAWVLGVGVFVVAFLVTVTGGARDVRARVVLLAVQSAAALVAVWTGGTSYAPALLAVVAGQAPLVLEGRLPMAWIGAQTVGLALIELSMEKTSFAVASTGAYFGFQVFAFGAARLAQREAAARDEVTRINAELLATRELFADATRGAERLRIARELHDSLGHHLTALSINLDVARRARDVEREGALERSHAIAKGLLAQIRQVVGAMREEQTFDLAHALRTLVTGVPRPNVHLALPDALHVRDAGVAHVVFRCIQEAVTNAARHAGAANVWVDVNEDKGTLAVSARDDGRGADSVRRGHGLTGLAERVEALGGQLEITSRAGQGFTLKALLPSRGEP
jgi:signal transduction histidine kinase